MNTEKKQTIDELKNEMIETYKDQVQLLKAINDTNETIINTQKEYINKLEQGHVIMMEQLEEYRLKLFRMLCR
jgi:hypothetical protein